MNRFLRHAGVWTVEEATRMCRDKMIRLRSLYIAQFKRLQHVLKERKRKYCQAIQAEEEEDTGIGTYKGWCMVPTFATVQTFCASLDGSRKTGVVTAVPDKTVIFAQFITTREKQILARVIGFWKEN